MKESSLAEKLFESGGKYSPEVVLAFAHGIVQLNTIRAVAWAMASLLNFAFLIIVPLYGLVTDQPNLGWLLIPGCLFGIGMLAMKPTGTEGGKK